MSQRDLAQDDPLADFTALHMTIEGVEKRVWVAGDGLGVIVMAEMPGISPHVARFARWVRDAGFRVYMPSLFGRDGAVADAESGAETFRRACISAEFRALGGGTSSPVARWLMGLARLAHDECGGAGVGAVGMCFTGNFALTMMLEPAVRAPVLCQPSLPLDNPAGIEIAPDELAAVARRMELEDLNALGLRFAGDPFCRAERFAAYRAALGDRFTARVVPDDAANPATPSFFARHVPAPHSVVTVHLVDEAGSPTLAARDEILAFLRAQLGPNA
ncbi:dienelactone hydrolase family protein [Sphingomonas sp. G-3-2-10]|uniref:dienelactone hydrolase family protein n=1 Tax=Sphingomonas sp. G-3-2-10 TaxID=2728838 RepID=UPI00146BBDA6|nr:dienelactone hydrolase family protein [Sphingomonas sp. G-3-2-10]NML05592.1 dienelactone hydrolase [Sphingomonas sp. G-3-2-10]